MYVLFITQPLRVVGRLGTVNRFNHTSWVTVVTPTDSLKSARNRCVIEVFGGVFVLLSCYFEYSVVVGASVIGLSHISSFFSYGGPMSQKITLNYLGNKY